MKLASRPDRETAIVLIVFFAALLYVSRGLGYYDEYAPAAGFVPIWVAICGIALAVVMLLTPPSEMEETSVEPVPSGGASRVLLSLASLVLFAVLSPFLGMVPAGFLMMLFLLLVVLKRPLPASLLTSFVSAALVYGIFVAWLNVAIPKGIFGI